jgi:hypothetical protein
VQAIFKSAIERQETYDDEDPLGYSAARSTVIIDDASLVPDEHGVTLKVKERRGERKGQRRGEVRGD